MKHFRELGNVFILTAPSGTGKSTLIERLVKSHPELAFSVSYTTRAPRAGELDGTHYHFTDRATFAAMVAEDAFLEHASFVDNDYGTSRAQVQTMLAAGRDVLLEIEVEGARQVKAKLPHACAVFIYPPDYDTLQQRLVGRGSDSPTVIAKRLARATREVRCADLFDYALINDDLDRCFEELLAVFKADRLRTHRRSECLRAILDTFPEIG